MCPRKSDVWKHFNKHSDLEAECKHCNTKVKRCGNTTNLNNHLKRNHSVIFNDKSVGSCLETKRKKRSSQIEDAVEEISDDDENSLSAPSASTVSTSTVSASTSSTSTVSASTSSTSTPCTKISQPSITKCVTSIKSMQDGGFMAGKIKNALLYMIAKDDLPLSTVDKEGFKYLMKVIVPLYKVPGRSTMSSMVDMKYKILSAKVKQDIKEAQFVSLTTDVWTDPLNTVAYLGITCHFIQDCKLRSINLDVYKLSERHTAENLGDALLKVLSNWSISHDKVVCITTDNAPNIVKAVVDNFGVDKHLGCFAHSLNLIANQPFHKDEGDAESIKVLNSVKAIVGFFKRSVNASDDLKKCQAEEDSVLKLIQSVSTRWNSKFYQLRRFLELSSKIAPILLKYENAPPMLSANEMQIIEDLIQVFAPLEELTKEVSGESYATVGLVIPLINCLKNAYAEIFPKSAAGTNCKSILLNSIAERFSSVNIEGNEILAIGNLLDPRFKKIHFNNSIYCSLAVDKISGMLSERKDKTDIIEISYTNLPSTSSVWNFHNKLAEQNRDQAESISGEDLEKYLSTTVCGIKTDVITYWCDKNEQSKNLSDLALKYQIVMSTSVPCERVFSLAGNILTDKRNRLEKLGKLLFLKSLKLEEWHINE